MPDQHSAKYRSTIEGMALQLIKLGVVAQPMPATLHAAGDTLPRQGDAPEKVLLWRSVMNDLCTLAAGAEELRKAAQAAASILHNRIEVAGLGRTIFPTREDLN